MRPDVVPAWQEGGERRLGHGFDLLPEHGHRPPFDQAQHVRMAPLWPRRLGHEPALDHPPRGTAGRQAVADHARGEAEVHSELVRGEGPVRPAVPGDQVGHRVRDGYEMCLRDASGHGRTQPVAQACGVLDDCPYVASGDPGAEDATLRLESFQPLTVHTPEQRVLGGQRPQHPQQIGSVLRPPGAPLLGQVLDLGHHLPDRLGLQQVAQVGLAQQLAQKGRVERERRRPPLGQRRVSLVQVLRHVAEEQGSGEGRGRRRRDLDDADPPVAHRAHERHQGGDVVDIPDALAHRLEHDRESGVLGSDLEELRRALPLLPERCPSPRSGSGQKQGARGALPEPCGEQCRPADQARDVGLDLVGIREQARGRLGQPVVVRQVGQPGDDAVVTVQDGCVDAEPAAESLLGPQGPTEHGPEPRTATGPRVSSPRARRGSVRRR